MISDRLYRKFDRLLYNEAKSSSKFTARRIKMRWIEPEELAKQELHESKKDPSHSLNVF